MRGGNSSSPAAQADDLATLSFLSEDILCEALKTRYLKNEIYTYVGDILIILNPYQDLGLYGDEASIQYRQCARNLLPPHVFAIADAAYTGMSQGGNDQVCIVSGESGAGKTETTKHLIKHVLNLSQGSSTSIQTKIIKSSPITEAFGNAKTAMNHNSSRFGKFMELHFDSQVQVNGISIKEYLLERPRVVRQNNSERGFHVFYYLVDGVKDEGMRTSLDLMPSPQNYNYLSASDDVPDNCKKMWADLQQAFEAVGFDAQTCDRIAFILAGILKLGNTEFNESDAQDDGADLVNADVLEAAAAMLQISSTKLQSAMMSSKTVMRGSVIIKRLTATQCSEFRDSTAKIIYGSMFAWLIAKVSELTNQGLNATSKSKICLLDIFGFENFEYNSFEQLCINVANEQLQFFFNEHIFKREIEEYYREGLDKNVVNVSYNDNTELLALLQGTPLSVFVILNEESKLRASSQKSLLSKLSSNIASRPGMSMQPDGFEIQHYAGIVDYDSTQMINKNRDDLPDLILLAIAGSDCPVLQQAFATSNTEIKAQATAFGIGKARKSRRASKREQRKKAKKKQTVAMQFTKSLKDLMIKMQACQPHFLRCIKPNRKAIAQNLDYDYTITQLRYTGVLETVRIRREGFAARIKFSDFLAQYGTLAFAHDAKPPGNAANCTLVLNRVKAKPEGFLLGKTKVLLKYYMVDFLAQQLRNQVLVAIKLQAHIRCFLAKLWFRGLQEQRRLAHAEAINFFETFDDNAVLLEQRLAAVCLEDSVRNPDFIEPPPEYSERVPKKVTFGGSFRKSAKGISRNGGSEMAEIGSRKHASELRKSKKMVNTWFKKQESKRLKRKSEGSCEIYPPVWFHEMISREEADIRLQDQHKGTFLVRVSESSKGYTLSVKDDVIVRNYKISVEIDLAYTMAQAPRKFDSLQELLDNYYSDILTDQGLVLVTPLPRPLENDEEIEYADVGLMPDGQVLLMMPSANNNHVDKVDYRNSRDSGPDYRKSRDTGSDYRSLADLGLTPHVDYRSAQPRPSSVTIDYRNLTEVQAELAALNRLHEDAHAPQSRPNSEYSPSTVPGSPEFVVGNEFDNEEEVARDATIYTTVEIGARRELTDINEDTEPEKDETWKKSRPTSEPMRKDSLSGWLPRSNSSSSPDDPDNFGFKIPMLKKKSPEKRRTWFS